MAETGLTVSLQQTSPIPLAVELHCAPGELLALVGPSGSGKSTVLRCIAGLHRPQQGVIRCDGETWFDAAHGLHRPPPQRHAGIVFQSYALFPHLSALENVMTALHEFTPVQRNEKARAWLDILHLSGLEQRRPHELSGGQQQRVAVARALAREPKVLLLDEPFSAVDQMTRRKLQRELAQLRRRLNIPIVLVTHDLDEARTLADHMLILHRGATLQHGTPLQVMTRPLNVAVARLVGRDNLFEATLESADAQHAFLRWRGYLLKSNVNPNFSPGSKVCWMIPAECIAVQRNDRALDDAHENRVQGIVSECVELGDTSSVTLHVDGDADLPLGLSVPTHFARRNALAAGAPITVALLREDIHLMPWEPLRERRSD